MSPDVNIAGQKFCIRLLIPVPEGMNEVYLRCENVSNYTDYSYILQHLKNASYCSRAHVLLIFCSSLSLQEKQYSEWMAACKLASKGLTMLNSSYQSEVKNIQTFLSMQRSNSSACTPQTDESINTQSLVSPRYTKKYKARQVLCSHIWAKTVQDLCLSGL